MSSSPDNKHSLWSPFIKKYPFLSHGRTCWEKSYVMIYKQLFSHAPSLIENNRRRGQGRYLEKIFFFDIHDIA